MNEIIQDVDKMGTQLKTISARIRGTTNELDEDAEEMTMTVADLRKELKSITGVDIMISDDEFKSTYQILDEISQVYYDLTDAQRASIGEMLGGKTGLNVVQAILENFDTAREVVDELNQGLAEGSADRELETALDSIQGKLNQIQSIWQQLSTNVVDSELIKSGLDFVVSVGKGLNGIASGLKEIKGVGAGLTTFAGLTGLGAFLNKKTGSGRVKMLALDEYARVSSSGNTERVGIIIVMPTRELWKNYRTWCIAQRVL